MAVNHVNRSTYAPVSSTMIVDLRTPSLSPDSPGSQTQNSNNLENDPSLVPSPATPDRPKRPFWAVAPDDTPACDNSQQQQLHAFAPSALADSDHQQGNYQHSEEDADDESANDIDEEEAKDEENSDLKQQDHTIVAGVAALVHSPTASDVEMPAPNEDSDTDSNELLVTPIAHSTLTGSVTPFTPVSPFRGLSQGAPTAGEATPIVKGGLAAVATPVTRKGNGQIDCGNTSSLDRLVRAVSVILGGDEDGYETPCPSQSAPAQRISTSDKDHPKPGVALAPLPTLPSLTLSSKSHDDQEVALTLSNRVVPSQQKIGHGLGMALTTASSSKRPDLQQCKALIGQLARLMEELEVKEKQRLDEEDRLKAVLFELVQQWQTG
ncbi:hypothetical protein IAU60_002368 [Kwoniella sp. DSM 27419]